MSFLHIATLVLEGLLGVFSAYTSYSLISQTPPSIAKSRAALHYPRWYWLLAGVLAALGAVGLLVGLALPVVAVAAAIWMVAYFVAAILTHVIRADWASLGTPLVFLVIFLGLTALLWSSAGPLLAVLGL